MVNFVGCFVLFVLLLLFWFGFWIFLELQKGAVLRAAWTTEFLYLSI